jgi:L-2,4-diaminobutyrate decarboxylase
MSDELRAAYDPAVFRARGHALVDQLADYLAQAEARALPVLPQVTPARMVAEWPANFPESPTGTTLEEIVARVLAHSNHLHHPRFVGHQVTAPLPSAALCDLVAALLNNGMAVFEMGPASTAMERALCRWLAAQIGFPEGADGIFTHGGSVGNLTALLAARTARAGFDLWREGNAAGPPLCVLASRESHYSVSRAVRILGWGEGGIAPVATDEKFRLRPDALAAAQHEAEARGRKVIAVVASAASTSTGAYDPLHPIADYCAERGLWLHVDGAHGASVALSPRHRQLVDGIERADSVVWDAHKLMLTPALCTAVLFRDGRRSYDTFAQQASYLFSDESGDGEWWSIGLRTLECTKRMLSLKLYATLALHGTKMFSDYVTAVFDQGARFAEKIRATSDFELATFPDGDIVCFRHRPRDLEGAALDAHQEKIRAKILASGAFYIVQTRLPAGIFLRVTLINPLTTDGDLDALLDAVRTASEESR